jgi:hypothetical protein
MLLWRQRRCIAFVFASVCRCKEPALNAVRLCPCRAAQGEAPTGLVLEGVASWEELRDAAMDVRGGLNAREKKRLAFERQQLRWEGQHDVSEQQGPAGPGRQRVRRKVRSRRVVDVQCRCTALLLCGW